MNPGDGYPGEIRDLLCNLECLPEDAEKVGEQAGPALDEEGLRRALREGFERTLGIRLREGTLTPGEQALRGELVEKKYGREEWNREGKRGEWISGL